MGFDIFLVDLDFLDLVVCSEKLQDVELVFVLLVLVLGGQVRLDLGLDIDDMSWLVVVVVVLKFDDDEILLLFGGYDFDVVVWVMQESDLMFKGVRVLLLYFEVEQVVVFYVEECLCWGFFVVVGVFGLVVVGVVGFFFLDGGLIIVLVGLLFVISGLQEFFKVFLEIIVSVNDD